MDKYKISIIIPLYNVEQYVIDCLQSVARQTFYGAIECLIIDDCGQDTSANLVEQFMANYKGSITFRLLHHDHNRGLSSARNTGLDAAVGEYIYFLDSDDILEEKGIEILYNSIIKSDYAIAIAAFTALKDGRKCVYRQDWLIDRPYEIASKDFAEYMLTEKANFASTAKLYRRDVLKHIRFRIGKLNEDTLFIVDLIPIIESQALKCLVIPDYSYLYRLRNNSICHNLNNPIELAALENYEHAKCICKNNPIVYNWLQERQYLISVNLIRNKCINKKDFAKVYRYYKMIPNSWLKKGRGLKTYIHLLLFKYLPHLTHKILL